MMKFYVQNLTKCAPRLGTLIDIEHRPDYIIETPLPMFYTRGGNLPNTTNEVFKSIQKSTHILQIPLVSMLHFQEAMEEYPGSISEFVGMHDSLTCITVQDPGDATQSGHNFKDHLPLWTRSGKFYINAQKYMDCMEAFRPDMYYFLADGNTNATSTYKRISKAVDNTLGFYEHCLERHKNSKPLRNSFALASIVGGYSTTARKKCIDVLTKQDIIKGFLIDGLHNNGPEVEFITYDEIKSIVEFVVNNLPEEKLRVVQGCWNPTVILKLAQLGIDMFDSSYCNLVTERSSALVFSFNENDDQQYEINLRHPRFADDFNPIMENCGCLTCKKHTKAYIHHLVTVQELLGPLLLTIHNNHHFLKFFKKIRQSIKDGTIKELDDIMEKKFKFHQQNMNQRQIIPIQLPEIQL